MIQQEKIDGISYTHMIEGATANLKAHAEEVDNLNVFPIPDGDTGENMLMTMLGGEGSKGETENLAEAAKKISGGMLFSARGNSGVILSQFFEGITAGLSEFYDADAEQLGKAFKSGVEYAYKAVMEPTEGTILTVIREATEYACSIECSTPCEFLDAFLREARASLKRTPDLLPVLKKAGVVDSGGAGLIYIVEGMKKALQGDFDFSDGEYEKPKSEELDFSLFDENSELEFGYCTELLLRLQTKKTDVDAFETTTLTDYLGTIGDSIVAVKSGSIVKIHVHTMTPYKVLEFCQRYGEYLKVKIENMSLQHNNTVADEKKPEAPAAERRDYAVIAVASGEGLKENFLERGADIIVDGGQSMNPSAEDFIEAFDKANADNIFVLPNNSNIILTAIQAAKLYEGASVHVLESRNIGEGYAALSMYDTTSMNTEEILQGLKDGMEGVITAEISHCVRDANIGGAEIHTGDYIGFAGKALLGKSTVRTEALLETLRNIGFEKYDICILFVGRDAGMEEAERMEAEISKLYKGKEIYLINGNQEVYDYIIVIE